jgi:hypothetical protein
MPVDGMPVMNVTPASTFDARTFALGPAGQRLGRARSKRWAAAHQAPRADTQLLHAIQTRRGRSLQPHGRSTSRSFGS